MIPYLNLAVYVCLSFVAGFLTSSLRLSTWLLQGLHSYLYPEPPGQQQAMFNGSGLNGVKGKRVQRSYVNANEGLSKPEETHDSESTNCDAKSEDRPYVILKKRDRKKKDKFSWEEGSSQIYRLTLSHSHVVGRLYYPEYDEVVVYTVVGLANLLAYHFLSCVLLATDEYARKFDIIPFLMGLFSVYKIVRLLASVSWQSSTSRVSELILSTAVGCIGFILALSVLCCAPTSALNFGFQGLFLGANASFLHGDMELRQQVIFFIVSPTLARILVATVAGLLAGVLVSPAHKCVRSFWIGTDQLEWNIPLAKWGVLIRFLLHLNFALPLVASILWIKPMGELFIVSVAAKQAEAFDSKSNVAGGHSWGKLLFPAPSADWANDFGISRAIFGKVQFWSLLMAGMLQLCLFRVNVQTYLNEAVIVWYESLHRSKVMNLDLTRAKLLLISYFLCRAAVQFFAPGMLLALLLTMSQIWGGLPPSDLARASPSLLFLRVAAIFLAWWVSFIWSILTCVTLALYRIGFLLAS